MYLIYLSPIYKTDELTCSQGIIIPESSVGQRNRRHQEPPRGSQDHHVRVEPGRPEQDGAPALPLPRTGSDRLRRRAGI